MSTRTPRSPEAAAETAAATQADTVEQSRQGLALYAEGTTALLRGAEAFHQVQLQMLQRLALNHQQAAEKLRSANSPVELASVQSELMVSGLQELTRYMQDLVVAGMRVQGEMMSNSPAPAAARAATPPNALGPMLQAWQTMFMGPLNGAAAGRTH